MRTFLVDHYWPGATARTYDDAMEAVASAAAAMAADGAEIRILHSTFVPGDEAALCVVAANEEATVRAAYRAANVPCDRIVEAIDSDQAVAVPIHHPATDGIAPMPRRIPSRQEER